MLAMSSTENHSCTCLEQFGGGNLTLYGSGFVFLFFTTVPLTRNLLFGGRLPPFCGRYCTIIFGKIKVSKTGYGGKKSTAKWLICRQSLCSYRFRETHEVIRQRPDPMIGL